jgi:K(+)-stimulated pyrophosphate-energized sodium pump
MAITALALVSAFVEIVGTDLRLEIVEPLVLVGMFFGGTLPFLFTSLTLTAVGDAASEMVEEIRRQFREIPGILTGTGTPDHARCIAIATDAALKRMPLPALIALAAPLGVGFGFGAQALAGMLVGALLSGVLLALLLANAGAAWDNAKKYVEHGHLGGKGSPVHHACVVGDTVGDPFKDTSGPSLNILIKVLAITSLVIAPFL